MRVLLVYAHPEPRSLNGALRDVAIKELEAEGLVERQVMASTPVKVDYHLTRKDLALEPVLESIGKWATGWVELPEADTSNAETAC